MAHLNEVVCECGERLYSLTDSGVEEAHENHREEEDCDEEDFQVNHIPTEEYTQDQFDAAIETEEDHLERLMDESQRMLNRD